MVEGAAVVLDEDDDDDPPSYRPLHPFREGITIGMCIMLVATIIAWLLLKVLG